jgi:hypothetical protein
MEKWFRVMNGNEIAVPYFEAPSQHLLLQAERKHKTPQSFHPMSELGIEHGTFIIRNGNVSNSTTKFGEIEEGYSRGETRREE